MIPEGGALLDHARRVFMDDNLGARKSRAHIRLDRVRDAMRVAAQSIVSVCWKPVDGRFACFGPMPLSSVSSSRPIA